MVILLLIILLVTVIGGRILYLSNVTTGESVLPNKPTKSALLVLDVQNDTLGVKEYTNTEMLINNINAAISYADSNGIDILYTKQVFSNPLDLLLTGSLYKKDSNGAELSQQLIVASSHVFEKERTDAFTNAELESYLYENQTTLYIVGADASACVYKTALAGKNRNYEVVILEDCIFSINDKFLEKALADYNKNGIEIKTLSDFVQINN